ncbi:angio-associated migratory cell protein isoform X2 [Bradysia coprophila]|nr:angio-associated migratory cell protein isoform X2 [Bradysia coprophila]
MRNNTPPTSPYNSVGGDEEDDGDELIYVGDADEVLNEWEQQIESDDENGDDAAIVDNEMTVERDDAVLTFTKHNKPVFCGSLHPSLDLAVTGGEDDKAYVWSTETGEVVYEVDGHKDSIVCAQFSSDGNFLATGDLAGDIQVFKVNNNYSKVWEFSMGDMAWMQWHTSANVLLAGGESGEVYVWRIPSGECKVLQGNGHKSEVGELTNDGKKLIVGYGDGTIKLWDIKSSSVVQEILADSPLGHSSTITCIAADPDNGIFLSGSEDGKILIAGASGALGNLLPDSGSVESLAFCPDSDLKLAACGTLQGKISLWDIAKQAVRVECEKGGSGVTKLFWAPNHTLFCGTLDGAIRAFDGRSGQLKFSLLGHQAEVYD